MVSEQTKIECRKVQIRLLDALNDICNKHNLVYWLDFGTLLGAHMFKGFIPWDDDIDVSMPMKDYKKFLKIAEKELPNDIYLQTRKTDKTYNMYFSKLRDCYSTFVCPQETISPGYHQGIFIDIFPSVHYPKLPRIIRKILTHYTVRTSYNVSVLRKNKILNLPIYIFLKIIWLLLKPFNTSLVAMTPEDNGYNFVIPEEQIYPLKKIEFEKKLYPAPNKVHEYLCNIWPNYTPTPPIETRIPHASEVYINKPCDHPRALKRKKHEQK
jgi:lipopolysaccharide cholinephosphotransferase